MRLPRLLRLRPDADLGPAEPGRRTLRLYLLKPSKYDDDGSVLAFHWGVIPSNTLIVLAGLAEAYAQARPDLDLQLVLWDELVDGVVSETMVDSIVQKARRDEVTLVVGLVAVQTNQYPRARDVALQLCARGVLVVMGGFHVSSHASTRTFLASAGVTVVIGETEASLAQLLEDVLADRVRPLYRVEAGVRARTGVGEITVPLIEDTALPAVNPRYLRSFLNPSFATIDTSRGCPFVCSFCSVKNVMGRTMRSRDPARILDWVRDAHDRFGVRNLLVVDDDFFRSPRWRDVLAGLARLRRGGRDVSFLMQVDVEASLGASARSEDFVDLAAAAGCFQVFVGLESFDPANIAEVAKHQNDGRESGSAERVRDRYARAVAAWHRAGIAVHAGYIVGLPHDAAGCGRQAARDLAAIGVDLASFFAYTPFPGTEDHAAACARGDVIDTDFDRYDSTHFVMRHPQLGSAELAREYCEAWRTFYSWRRLAWSVGTWHRMAGLSDAARAGMVSHTVYYTYAERRGWHPMLGGVWRRRGAVRRAVVSDEDAACRYLRSPIH